jgi:NTP pyrophosphatase (non-canonical NTP hydrolase)
MFSNKLSPAEAERLALFIEECGEAVQAAGKILRHGYDSWENRKDLEKEVADIFYAVRLMTSSKDLSEITILVKELEKSKKVVEYLHHQDPELLQGLINLAENELN